MNCIQNEMEWTGLKNYTEKRLEVSTVKSKQKDKKINGNRRKELWKGDQDDITQG